MTIEKIEIDIYVDLSSRQRALYRALLANVSVADLLEKAANIGDADSARSLMNLVMQFRKASYLGSSQTNGVLHDNRFATTQNYLNALMSWRLSRSHALAGQDHLAAKAT